MISAGQSTAVDVELIFFSIGGRAYGAEAAQVVRVAGAEVWAREAPQLGRLSLGQRTLVYRQGPKEAGLKIDAVLGVRSAPAESLRRFPKAIHRLPYALGLWLDEKGTPIVLLDLAKL